MFLVQLDPTEKKARKMIFVTRSTPGFCFKHQCQCQGVVVTKIEFRWLSVYWSSSDSSVEQLYVVCRNTIVHGLACSKTFAAIWGLPWVLSHLEHYELYAHTPSFQCNNVMCSRLFCCYHPIILSLNFVKGNSGKGLVNIPAICSSVLV
jgi:hypothetical protein